MILFLAMCTFFVVIMCCMIIDDSQREIHRDSHKGSFYEISNRKD